MSNNIADNRNAQSMQINEHAVGGQRKAEIFVTQILF